MKFLQQSRQEIPKPLSKSRLREKQREDKETEEISAFFSNKKLGNKNAPGKVDPIKGRSRTRDDLSVAGSTAVDCNEKSSTCSPRSPRQGLHIARHRRENGKPATHAAGNDINRPEAESSAATTYFAWPSSSRSLLARDSNVNGEAESSSSEHSPTPDSIRKALAETGVYCGLEDSHRQRSRSHGQRRPRVRDRHDEDIAVAKSPNGDGPSAQQDQKQRVQYHDRGVMTSKDRQTPLEIHAHAPIGDDPNPERSLLAISREINEVTPALEVEPGNRPDGREDGDENRKQDEGLHIDRGKIAQQAYINRKEPPLERLEPPPRPKPPKSTVVERLESQAELGTESIIGSTYLGVNTHDQAPLRAVEAGYFTHHEPDPNPECTPSAALVSSLDAPIVDNTSAIFRHSLSHPAQSISAPLATRLWRPNQHVISQSWGGVCHRPSPEFSHLANSLGEATDLEPARHAPGVTSHESMRDFIGRIEQEALEEADYYGQSGASIMTSPSGPGIFGGDLESEQVQSDNYIPPGHMEIPWEVPRGSSRQSTAGHRPDFGRNPPVVESLGFGGRSGVGVEAHADIDETAMSRFWPPNQYGI